MSVKIIENPPNSQRPYSPSPFPCTFFSGYLSGYPLEEYGNVAGLSHVTPYVTPTHVPLDLHVYRHVSSRGLRRGKSYVLAGLGVFFW